MDGALKSKHTRNVINLPVSVKSGGWVGCQVKSVASVKISFPTNLLQNPAAAPIYACIESLLCRTIILLHPAAHSSIALCFHCALQHNLLHPNAAQRFYLLPLHCVSTVQCAVCATLHWLHTEHQSKIQGSSKQ